MNATQQKALNAIRDELANNLKEDPADQVYIRFTTTVEGARINVQAEGRIENPDTGYESNWSWVDGFLMNRVGRRL